MYTVSLRAAVARRDADYAAMAAHLGDLALTQCGFLDYADRQQDGLEIAVSFWSDQRAILVWREDPAHRAAQQRGSQHWNNGHRVEVAEICRAYCRAGRHAT